MKKLLLSIAIASMFSSVNAQKQLILYFSETGTTEAVAKELKQQLNADMERIETVVPYSGNFQETIQRSQREMQNGETPELKPIKSKINSTEHLKVLPMYSNIQNHSAASTTTSTLVRKTCWHGSTMCLGISA